VGHAIAKAFRLDASAKDDKARINGIVRQLLQAGRIEIEARNDKNRKLRQFVRVTARQIEEAPPSGVFD
jgi:hypothetical protein